MNLLWGGPTHTRLNDLLNLEKYLLSNPSRNNYENRKEIDFSFRGRNNSVVHPCLVSDRSVRLDGGDRVRNSLQGRKNRTKDSEVTSLKWKGKDCKWSEGVSEESEANKEKVIFVGDVLKENTDIKDTLIS